MSACTRCGEGASLPYTCSYCGETFCKAHRLPENHGCVNLSQASAPSTSNLTARNLSHTARARDRARRTGTSRALVVALAIVLVIIVAVVAGLVLR